MTITRWNNNMKWTDTIRRTLSLLGLLTTGLASVVIGQDSDAPPAEEKSAITSGLVSPLAFRNIGPALMSGRIGDIVVDPVQRSTWYVAASSGGVWKTTNAGTSWTNTTKGLPSLAVTSLDLAKTNPDIIYAGTGEAVGGSVGLLGSGVYKSIDGGDTWSQLPSTTSKEFSVVNRIAVSPTDPQIIFLCTSEADN